MKKFTIILTFLLLINFVTFSQNYDTKEENFLVLNSNQPSLEKIKKQPSQQQIIKDVVFRLHMLKKERVKSKKEMTFTAKKELKQKNNERKITFFENKKIVKNQKQLEIDRVIALQKVSKETILKNKIEKTVALKTELKQLKKLLKNNAIDYKRKLRNKKLLEKAEIITIKETSKRNSIKNKIEKTLALKKQLKELKRLLKVKALEDKKVQKNKRLLDKAEILATKEALKKEKKRIKIEKTVALKTELKLQKQLIEIKAIEEKREKKKIVLLKRDKAIVKINISKIDFLEKKKAVKANNKLKKEQLISSKEKEKKANIKKKKSKILFKGEVKKIYN